MAAGANADLCCWFWAEFANAIAIAVENGGEYFADSLFWLLLVSAEAIVSAAAAAVEVGGRAGGC